MPMKNWGAGLGLLVMLAPGARFAAGLPAQDATYRAIAARRMRG